MWSLHVVAEHLWKYVYVIRKGGGSARTQDAQTGQRSAVTTPLIRERLASLIIQRYVLPLHPSPRLGGVWERVSGMEEEMGVKRETPAQTVGNSAGCIYI